MNAQMQGPQKKIYTSPELKEWGAIADITLGTAFVGTPDTAPGSENWISKTG